MLPTQPSDSADGRAPYAFFDRPADPLSLGGALSRLRIEGPAWRIDGAEDAGVGGEGAAAIMQQWLARWCGRVPLAGYLGYEAGRLFDAFAAPRERDHGFPDVDLWACSTVGRGEYQAPGRPLRLSAFRWAQEPEAHLRAVRRAKLHIRRGDIFEVNVARRFEARVEGDSADLYARLRAVAPVPQAAYLQLGHDRAVLSASPERFFEVSDAGIATYPIKGTRARSDEPEADAAAASELLASEKDRAELAMIVDLCRNDLGRIAETGSVAVASAARLRSFPSVHHLEGEIRARLRPETTVFDILRAQFPGGSITGAPKLRAVEIIRELEPVRRGPYTGAIGWIDGPRRMDFSIAIRTLLWDRGRVLGYVGGAVTADSDPLAELEETGTKAVDLLRALGLDGSLCARKGKWAAV